MNELRIAPTVEDLKDTSPIIADNIHISIDKSTDDSEQVTRAMPSISRLTIEISVTTTQFAKNMRRIMRSLFPYALLSHGYIIVNRRGRNKLVDIRRYRNGKT